MSKLPLAGAIARVQANDERLDIFTNGTDTQDYQTSSGSMVPSVRKFLKKKDDEINVGANSILADVLAARDLADASAIAADLSADAAAADAAVITAQLGALSAPNGSTLVGYKHPNAQSYASTLYDKERIQVTLQDFMTTAQKADVEAGALLVDVSSAFTKMFAAGVDCFVPNMPGAKYLIGDTVIIPSGIQLRSNGAKIFLANGVNNHVFRLANGADGVKISGLVIDGNKNNNTGGSGISTGPFTNLTVNDCIVFNCSSNGIFANGPGSVGVTISGCEVSNCFSAGITGDGIKDYLFVMNKAWLNGTHGVGLIGTGVDGVIASNAAWDNGQGTPNADNFTGYNSGIDNLVVIGNVSRGGLNNGIHFGGQRITLTGNTAYGATQYGIVMRPDTGVGDDCVMNDNVSYSNGVSGFWIENCNSGSVSGNVSRNNIGNGFAIDACVGVSFTGNSARGNGQDGFRNGTASQYLAFTGNTSRANAGDGIEISNITDSVFTGNIFSANTGWGVNPTGTSARNIISNNKVRSNTAGQINTADVTTRVHDNDTNTSRTLASAAALPVPPDGEYFYVTGTTAITSIPIGFAGRRLTLQFDAALTVTDGGNLNLAGNYATAFKSTLTLISDGTNWVECSRSNN